MCVCLFVCVYRLIDFPLLNKSKTNKQIQTTGNKHMSFMVIDLESIAPLAETVHGRCVCVCVCYQDKPGRVAVFNIV